MGKQTRRHQERQEQRALQSDEAKKLLDGIIETDISAQVSIATATGARFMLDLSYDDAIKMISEADPGVFLRFKTYSWVGSRQQEMEFFHVAYRADTITEVNEITHDMWVAHVTDQFARAQAMAIKQSGILG
jgi:hypothetical protein